MMRSIAIYDVLLYVITAVVVIGLSFYFTMLIRATYSVSLDSNTYLLFLNSLYASRLNYCIYTVTHDPKYLFYLDKDIDTSNIPKEALEKCFSKVTLNTVIILGNFSLSNEKDLERLSQFVCNEVSESFIEEIKNEYKGGFIAIYQPKEVSTVPIFLFYNPFTNEKKWIFTPVYTLFSQEKGGWVEGIANFFRNLGSYIITGRSAEENLMLDLRQNANQFINCKLDKEYAVFPMYAIQALVVDTNRNLYIETTLQFIKVKNSGDKIVVVGVPAQGNKKPTLEKISWNSLMDKCPNVPNGNTPGIIPP